MRCLYCGAPAGEGDCAYCRDRENPEGEELAIQEAERREEGATLEVGQRVYDHRRGCGAFVEEVGTNPDYPDRVLVRYDRMLSERVPMVGVQSFGMDWVLPEWVEAIEEEEG